jgi:type IV secretory pathway VirB10-like protein
MPCSSFRQGMITVMLCDLYTIAGGRWYHILMKLFCALVLLAASVPAAVNQQLKQVNTVYILGMSGGMDQYLANRLTNMGVFQVVTDPQKADAIITDRLGEPFEAKLKELYPPPPPPPPPAPPAPPAPAKDAKDAKDDKDSKIATTDKTLKDDKDNKDKMEDSGGALRVGGFNRGRGNIFIVDRKSKNVVWSTYERPKDTTPGELSKTAEKVVKRLKDDLSDKKQANN